MEKSMVAKFDCLSGKEEGRSRRYIIGKPGSPISGAIYIRQDTDVPETVVLTLTEGRGGD